MIGVEGFDALIRAPEDLERLPRLFERGVRLFQPVYNATGLLAGSSVAGDDRGLTDLGRRFLEALTALGTARPGPRPIVDLAHLNPKSPPRFSVGSSRTPRDRTPSLSSTVTGD